MKVVWAFDEKQEDTYEKETYTKMYDRFAVYNTAFQFYTGNGRNDFGE